MIGYVTLGAKDLARAAEFYDAMASELGTGRMMENEQFIAWGTPGGGAGIGLIYPHNGQPATVGNGVMVALAAGDKAQVDRLHALALSLGGSCEGPPAIAAAASMPPISATATATSSTHSSWGEERPAEL